MPKIMLAVEFGQVGTGTKADLRFCRLPVRPQCRSDPTDSRPVAEPSGQNTGNTVTTRAETIIRTNHLVGYQSTSQRQYYEIG